MLEENGTERTWQKCREKGGMAEGEVGSMLRAKESRHYFVS